MAEVAAHEQQQQQDKDLQPLPKTPPATSRSKIMIVGLLAMSALFLMTFSAFGCYGVYTFFFGGSHQILQKKQLRQSQDEVVIRIIRQVIHVDAATGHVLKKIDDSSKGKDLSLSSSKSSSFSLLQEPHVMDKISECVATVMDD